MSRGTVRPAFELLDTLKAGYVALLRGVNVGGKNSLPMNELTEMFRGAGCGDVRTYIQSGNVIFSATAATARRLPGIVAASITRRYGYTTPVIMRSAAEVIAAVRNNPFLRAGADESSLHIMFLADAPKPGALRALDPARSTPDEFIVRGRDVYLLLPNGAARTKLSNAYFDAKLGTVGTQRNWRTVRKLSDMLEG